MAFLAAHWMLLLSLLGGTGGLGALSFFFPAQALLAVRALWAWLCHRSFWQLVSLALGCIVVVQHFTIIHDRAEAAKWQKHYSALETQVKKRQSESKVQQQQVTKVIEHYSTVEKPVIRTEVQKIESAPLPGNCRSPKEVLGADV